MAPQHALRAQPSDSDVGFEKIERPASVAVRVAGQLRQMIIDGRIRLGDQLSENRLADLLGVSRMPVREAFMKLEAEKLVEVRPQRGTFVFTCDGEEAREICEVRAILETSAMRIAARIDRSRLVARLMEIVMRSEATLSVSAAAYQPFDIDFHNAIFETAGNRNLAEAYARIAGRVSALRWRLTRTCEQVRDSHAIHLQIVERLAEGDDAAACALMEDHVGRTYVVIRSLFDGELDIPVELIAGVRWNKGSPE